MLIFKYCLSGSVTVPALGLQLHKHYLPHSAFYTLTNFQFFSSSREISANPELEIGQTCARLKKK